MFLQKINAVRDLSILKRNTYRWVGKNILMYLSIALTVIVMLLPVYRIAQDSVKNTLKDQLQNDMESNLRLFESELDKVEALVSSLSMNESMTYLTHIQDNNGLHATKIKELHAYFSNALMLNTSLIDDYVVLIPNSQFMLSGTGISRSSAYYGRIVSYNSFSDESAYEQALFQQRLSSFPQQKVHTALLKKAAPVLTLNYYSNTSTKVYYAVSLLVCEDTLRDLLLSHSLRQNGYLILSAPDGSTLATLGVKTDTMDILETRSIANGRFSVEYGIEHSVYVEDMQRVRHLIMIYCLTALFVSAALSLALAYQNLHPLKEIEALLGQIFSENDEHTLIESSNMMRTVRNSLNKTVTQAELLKQELRTTLAHAKNDTMLSLMKGVRVPNESDVHLLAGEEVLSGRYILCQMILQDDAETTSIMHENALSAASSLISLHFPGSYITSKRPFVFLLPFKPDTLSLLNETLSNIGAATIPAYTAASSPNTGLDGLSSAYAQMQAVLKNGHLFMFKDEHVMCYEELLQMVNNQEDITGAIDEGFVRLLTKQHSDGEVTARLNLMRRQFDRIALEHPQRLSISYYTVLTVFESLYRAMKVDQPLQEFDPEMPVVDIEDYLCHVFYDLDARIQAQRDRLDPHVGIVTYIEEHYRDAALSLTSLSEQFNLSEGYISSIIKRCTNMSYSAYLEKLRMQKAGELLCSTNMNVGDISIQLGYDNQNTFFKAFKRYYKTSPGAYRSNKSVSGLSSEEMDKSEP